MLSLGLSARCRVVWRPWRLGSACELVGFGGEWSRGGVCCGRWDGFLSNWFGEVWLVFSWGGNHVKFGVGCVTGYGLGTRSVCSLAMVGFSRGRWAVFVVLIVVMCSFFPHVTR